ncbi:MAG TPA: heavy metal resistance protein CzcR [Verrucomicrobiales bacterium]|nr:heavy metal resistance protein CzcR [Verrucomicrobiales bacterium]
MNGPDYAARCAQLTEELDQALERIEQLEAELGLAYPVPLVFGLTGQQTCIFGVLMARPFASNAALMLALYSDKTNGDAAEPDIIKVHICKMRQKLKPFGVEIETMWGQGYRISDEHKAIVRAMLAEES